MYFVDREKINELLQFMEQRLQMVDQVIEGRSAFDYLALERIGHTLIETVLDVGNAMIDGFIMRDPGSYEDIVDILLDEKVVDEQLSTVLIQFIAFRKPLVQQYTEDVSRELAVFLQENKQQLATFPECVSTYLINELGPVSAFRN